MDITKYMSRFIIYCNSIIFNYIVFTFPDSNAETHVLRNVYILRGNETKLTIMVFIAMINESHASCILTLIVLLFKRQTTVCIM